MDNEPEVIRQQMAETRTSLSDKIETLEEKVVGTVEGATSAVADTVDNVKEAVHETVATVKDTVQDAVEGVKETFDLPWQVDRHPWLMMGASVAVGYMGGCLLGRWSGHTARRHDHQQRLRAEGDGWSAAARPQTRSWIAEERAAPPIPPGPPAHAGMHERRWVGLFGPELAKLKGMAIGYLGAAVRDLMSQSLPESMRQQVRETMDSITQKLGGQPVQGPVLGGARGSASPSEQGPHGSEERTARGSFTDAQGRW
jgi:ElaB/YqjD/DUF883 family membrane-anchored ribosome-binding protein